MSCRFSNLSAKVGGEALSVGGNFVYLHFVRIAHGPD